MAKHVEIHTATIRKDRVNEGTMSNKTYRLLKDLPFAISYRKSTSVVVDETKLTANWLREIPATHVVDKAEIAKALKAGETVEGATLITNNNIQIK